MTIIAPLAGLSGKTFLQLTQELRQEVGAAGTGPSTVIGQTGEYGRLVKWIHDADMEIQQVHDQWKFKVGTFSLDTVAGVSSYAASQCSPAVTDLRTWRPRTAKIYLLAAGVTNEIALNYIDYEAWYVMYGTGPQSNTRPIHWTIGNEMELLIGPQPNDVYRITGEYHRASSEMLVDDDQPPYPAEFHMLPVYLAMMKYGRFTAAGEVYSDGERLYKQMLRRMERTQLPRLNWRMPLA